MNNGKNSYDGIVCLVGIIVVIALMFNPLLTGYVLIKIIELGIIVFVVNIGTRILTGKTLLGLWRSIRENRDED